MRTSAIIRVFVYAFIAMVLTGVLICGIGGNHSLNFLSFSIFDGNGTSYNDKDYTVGGGTVSPSDVSDLQIDWTSGTVKVVPYSGDSIIIEEDSDTSLDSDYQMRYKVDDGVLNIKFAKSKVKLKGIFKNMSKELTVKVPEKFMFDEVEIDSVSAQIMMDQINCGSTDCSTVSGNIVLEKVSTNQFDGETVSGKMDCKGGSMDDVTMETVSGKIEMAFQTMPSEMDLESVSGDITLGFPENKGFQVDYDKVSGDFDCQFNVTINKSMATYKNGSCKIDMETVSGDMNILAI
jgi:DUF4097 and DUF4098 domain-containing protein YvlB